MGTLARPVFYAKAEAIRGQAPQNSELAEHGLVAARHFHPPILNSAVPDPGAPSTMGFTGT
jgi:hypothetical protein